MTTEVAQQPQQQGVAAMMFQYRSHYEGLANQLVHVDSFLRRTQGLLKRNDTLRKVAERNPQSFLTAVSDCIRLGLEPGDTYHFVPFGNEIQGIVDWTGELELIYRAGQVASIKAEVVCANDTFRYNPGDMDRPVHEVDWFGDRGDLIGCYAFAIMKDGAVSRVVVMGKSDIEKVKGASRGANAKDSPWNSWTDRMWLKTVIKQLSKWVPSSAEFRDMRAAAYESPPPAVAPPSVDTTTGEISEAEGRRWANTAPTGPLSGEEKTQGQHDDWPETTTPGA